jgi:opacity protein-like surface antigen
MQEEIMRKITLLCLMLFWLPLIAAAQDYPKAEIFAGYSYLRGDLDANLSGFDVSATANLNRWLGATADFSGHYYKGFELHSFLFGPKFTFRENSRVNPYLQAMIGPVRMESITVFGWAVGGGIDVKVHRNIAIRAIDMTYLQMQRNGYYSKNGRLSSGIVWRF